MTPFSTRMTTRGKSVCGKTAEGIVDAAYAPAMQRAKTMKTIAFE
jgi:hypothetical protein